MLIVGAAIILVLFGRVLTLDDVGSKLAPYHLQFLYSKGYLKPPDPYASSLKNYEEIVDALKELQKFAGLPITGKLDHNTILKFYQPRCGVADIEHQETKRSKRYVLKGTKWNKKKLTYRILNYSSDLSRTQIHQSIRRAFSRWQVASQLSFHEVFSGNADIMIKFARTKHDDDYDFDGPGGTLAHAFYPGEHELAGDTHFDDDEVFTLYNKDGKNFYWVALHEFGHAIGLEHNSLKGTIMYPWYTKLPGEDHMDLSLDDKKGVQALYGPPRHTTNKQPSTPVPSLRCINNARIILPGDSMDTIVINKDKVYLFNEHLLLRKGPVEISTYYPGIYHLNTAYKLDNGRTILLSGSSYWEFRGRTLIHGPEHVSSIGFTSNMHDLDAAFLWSRNNKVYMFKGRYYWRYDPYYNQVDPGYPKLITQGWKDVPLYFDSVFQWKRNKKIYFFKGSKYYRFNDYRYEVQRGYPQDIQRFLKCPTKLPKLSYLRQNKAEKEIKEEEDLYSTSKRYSDSSSSSSHGTHCFTCGFVLFFCLFLLI